MNKIISFLVLTMFVFACSAPSSSDSTTRNTSRASVFQSKASKGAIQSSDYGLTTAVNNGNLEITLHFAGGFNSPEFYTKHRTESIIIFGYASEFDFNGNNGYNTRLVMKMVMNSNNQMVLESAGWHYVTNNTVGGNPGGSVPQSVDLSTVQYNYSGNNLKITLPIPRIKDYLFDGSQPFIWDKTQEYIIHDFVTENPIQTVDIPQGMLCQSREIRPSEPFVDQITNLSSASEWGFAQVEKAVNYFVLTGSSSDMGAYQGSGMTENGTSYNIYDVPFSQVFNN